MRQGLTIQRFDAVRHVRDRKALPDMRQTGGGFRCGGDGIVDGGLHGAPQGGDVGSRQQAVGGGAEDFAHAAHIRRDDRAAGGSALEDDVGQGLGQ